MADSALKSKALKYGHSQLLYTQTYAPTTPAHDFWTLRYTTTLENGSLVDLILLLLTSGRDPSIIPRNAHPPEPEGYEESVEGAQTPQLRLPRIKEVK